MAGKSTPRAGAVDMLSLADRLGRELAIVTLHLAQHSEFPLCVLMLERMEEGARPALAELRELIERWYGELEGRPAAPNRLVPYERRQEV